MRGNQSNDEETSSFDENQLIKRWKDIIIRWEKGNQMMKTLHHYMRASQSNDEEITSLDGNKLIKRWKDFIIRWEKVNQTIKYTRSYDERN